MKHSNSGEILIYLLILFAVSLCPMLSIPILLFILLVS